MRDAQSIRRGYEPDDHASIAFNADGLGVVLLERGKYTEAETVFRESLAYWREKRETPHPAIASNLLNLGSVLRQRAQYEAAEPFLREAVASRGRGPTPRMR